MVFLFIYETNAPITSKKTTEEIIARNKRLREFYDKKREEGKPFRVAVIACVNKLLHWIYALLKSRTTFQDIA
jgi:transposase